jgi:hypothetical protein
MFAEVAVIMGMPMSDRSIRMCALGALAVWALGCAAGEAPAPDNAGDAPKKLVRQLRPEAIAPDNAPIYLSTPDLKRARTSFERTAFRAILGEEDVWSPIASSFAKLRDVYVKGDGTRSEAQMKLRGEEVDLLLKMAPMLEGGASLSVEGDGEGLNGISEGKVPRFLFVAALPPGDAGADQQQKLEDMLDAFRARLTIDAKYRDFDTTQGEYSVHGLENSELNVFHAWTFVENLFIFGQGKGMTDAAIERFSVKKGSGGLSQNADYLNAYKAVGRDEKGDSLVFIQFDPRPLLSKESLQSPWLQLLLPAGATKVSFGMQVGEGANAPIREKIFVNAPPAPAAEGAAKNADGVRNYSARFVPNDGLFYSAAIGALPELVERQKALLGSFFEGGAPAFEQKLAALVANKDLVEAKKKLELFKGEFSIFAEYVPRPMKSNTWDEVLSNFQFVLCLEIDRENVNYEVALKELMNKVEAATGIPYLTTNTSMNNSAGAIVKYQQGSASGTGEDLTFKGGLRNNLKSIDAKTAPFFACWTKMDLETDPGPVTRHFLLLSDDLPTLRKAISQRNSPRTSLGEDPKFQTLMKSFRETRSKTVYLDLLKLTNVYTSLIPIIAKGDMLDQDTRNQIPNMSVLRPHLYAMGQADSALPTAGGILHEYSSPTGNLTLGALIASIAWPALNNQRQRVISEDVDAHFRQIMLGLQLYAADFDRYPPNLSDLVPNYIDQKWRTVFESPFARGALQSPADLDNPELTNLIYIPTRTVMDMGSDIIVYEKQPTRLEIGETGTKLLHHVLRVDGVVRGMPNVALERVLAGKYTPAILGNKRATVGTGTKTAPAPVTPRPTPAPTTPRPGPAFTPKIN